MKGNMTLTIIVGLIIALVIMIVFLQMSGKSFFATRDFSSCESQGGSCTATSCDGSRAAYTCPKGTYCCMEGLS